MDFQHKISQQPFYQEAQLVVVSDSYSLHLNSGFQRCGMFLAWGGGGAVIYEKKSGMVIVSLRSI